MTVPNPAVPEPIVHLVYELFHHRDSDLGKKCDQEYASVGRRSDQPRERIPRDSRIKRIIYGPTVDNNARNNDDRMVP